MPLTGYAPRHGAPSRRRNLALPALLLVALVAPLLGLTVVASSGMPAVADTWASPDEPGEATLLAELSASRGTFERASRDRVLAEPAVAPVEPAPPPAPAFVRPSDGGLTSPFGRRWGRLHAGLDFATGTGAPVRAAAEGTVASAGVEGGYGLTVRVHHPDGAETVYAHLSSADVAAGQQVAAGQDLGREGSTGRSTGPHLHFEVRYDDAPVDPRAWLAERGVTV